MLGQRRSPLLIYCRSIIYNAGPTLIHHWVCCVLCANTSQFSDCCTGVTIRVTLSIPAPETPGNTIHWHQVIFFFLGGGEILCFVVHVITSYIHRRCLHEHRRCAADMSGIFFLMSRCLGEAWRLLAYVADHSPNHWCIMVLPWR